jgi:hypothetical protein
MTEVYDVVIDLIVASAWKTLVVATAGKAKISLSDRSKRENLDVHTGGKMGQRSNVGSFDPGGS